MLPAVGRATASASTLRQRSRAVGTTWRVAAARAVRVLTMCRTRRGPTCGARPKRGGLAVLGRKWRRDASGRVGPRVEVAHLSNLGGPRSHDFTYHATYTHPRGLAGAPKPPQLGSMSGWTGQAAQSTRLDDPRPSGPPARPSPASGTHRGGTTVGAASSPASPCCCLVLPFGSHQSQLPWQLLIASCHARGAA